MTRSSRPRAWGAGLLALAMAVTAAPAALAHSHDAAEPVVVVHTDFQDGSIDPWVQSGNPTLEVVEVGDTRALQVTGRTQSYEGIQTSPSTVTFQPGVEHTLTMRVRLLGDPGTTGQARWIGHDPGADNPFPWLGNTNVSADSWTTVTARWTPRAAADPSTLYAYPEIGGTGGYLLDDLLITRPAPRDGEGPVPGTVVHRTGFEEGLDGWEPRADADGTSRVVRTDTEAAEGDWAALVTDRTSQGHGIRLDVSDLMEAGVTYEISAQIKFAGTGGPGIIWLSREAVVDGTSDFGTIGQFPGITSAEWHEISITYIAETADTLWLYFETDFPSGIQDDFLLDDVLIRVAPDAEIQELTPLKDTMPMPVGVAVDQRETTGGPAALVLRHFDQITAENHMKPDYWYDAARNFRIHPQAAALMDFAAANDLAVYGHVLVWHGQTPDWFFQHADGTPLTSSEADQAILRTRMRTHIFNVAEALSAYGEFGAGNPLVAWDVVNEVVSDSGEHADGLRRSRWYDVLGEEFIDLAFRYADEAFNERFAAEGTDRPVALFINDYNTELSGKQNRYAALVDRLLEREVPIDGVGHQFHVSLSMPIAALEAALQRFQGTGLTQAVTELDVTVGSPVTEARLIEQGYYYRDAFRLFRQYADDLYSVTVWGLTDDRSWRSVQAPLLFDGRLQGKPAFFGAVDEALPVRQRAAFVFAEDIAVDQAALTSPVWDRLPLHDVDGAAEFQLRWGTDHLTVFVEVDSGDAVEMELGDETYRVTADGAEGVQAVTARGDGGSWTAVVRLPLAGAAEGANVAFDLRVVQGDTTRGWNAPGVLGTLTLVEPLSFVEVVEATEAPQIDAQVDEVWGDANVVSTDVVVDGPADGATAQIRTLWEDNTLFVLAEVADPVIDVSGSDPWVQDSVEIFLDAGNFRAGPYRYDDTQIRINVDNEVSFGTGDEAFQAARVESATSRVDGGYVVEAAISLLEYGGEGTFHGLDFQVNDGRAGSRYSVRTWADPTGLGYQSTERWGVAQLVATPATPPPAGGVVTGPPRRITTPTPVLPNSPQCVQVAGEVGVPDDAEGVIINVTSVRPRGLGHVVVYPSGATPTGSTVNFERDRDVANGTFVGIGEDGRICYVVRGAASGVLIDVTGYTLPGSGVTMQEPVRVLDTRPAPHRTGTIAGPVRPRTTHTVPVRGRGNVPADATSVLVNVTVTGATRPGNLRVFPGDQDRPHASTVNYAPGQTKANATMVPLAEDGTIAFWSDTNAGTAVSPVNVIIDVVGWATGDADLEGLEPVRLVDSRPGAGNRVIQGPLTARTAYPVDVAGQVGVPEGATAAVLNVTAIKPSSLGNLRVFPYAGEGTRVPMASSINYIPGRDIPNLVVVDLSEDGRIALWSDQAPGGTVHVAIDVVGYVDAQGRPVE